MSDMNVNEITPATETPVVCNTPQVFEEIDNDDANMEKYVGQCKWFSDKLGYGFLTICEGDKKGTDIFAHHSGIKPLNSNYKTLKKGEYIQFSIVNGVNGLQAVNVTGINGGALMCDFVTSKKPTDVSPPRPPRGPVQNRYSLPRQPAEEWNQVPTRRSSSHVVQPRGGMQGGKNVAKYNKATRPPRYTKSQ